jgi:hypothetical protein
VPTPPSVSEVVAAVASARLRLHGFYGGCKGTTLFRPLVAVVGSVLPSGAGVTGGATVGDHLPTVTGRTLGCGSGGPPEALFCAAPGVSERGQGSGVVQGRLPVQPPDMPRGAGATNTDPPTTAAPRTQGKAARCGCRYKVTSYE